MIKKRFIGWGWGGGCQGNLKFSLYFFGMSLSPALPWYADTPGRLPYETDRADRWKF